MNLHCTSDDVFYDLTVSISIIIIDGLEYLFPHRSLQEYFVSRFLSNQTEKTKKERIYTDAFMSRFRNGDYNLWHLCEEIDTYYFYKYFALNKAQNLLKALTNGIDDGQECGLNIFENIAKAFDLRIIYNDSNAIGTSLKFEGKLDFFTYLDLNNYMIFGLWCAGEKLYPQILQTGVKLDKDATSFSALELIRQDGAVDVLEQTGVLEGVYKIYVKVKDYINNAHQVVREKEEDAIFEL